MQWAADADAPRVVGTLAGADKYIGAVAAGYDAKRAQSRKWLAEQRIVESMLDGLPAGAWIVDCPVGTGRFLPLYAERKYQVWGCDKSLDMLAQAAPKAGRNVRLTHADILRGLPINDKSVDCAVMVRLSRWLSKDECRAAMAELGRVARRRIIFTARVRNHVHARPYELFALDGWHIVRDEEADGPDYRVIAMEPVA